LHDSEVHARYLCNNKKITFAFRNKKREKMFSGIVEEAAVVTRLVKDKDNLHITLKCSFTGELKIDQSVAHNGVCLTVVDIAGDEYTVTAIRETLDRSNLGLLREAHDHVVRHGFVITDDASAIETLGRQGGLGPGHHHGLKITEQLDLTLAQVILDGRSRA